MANQCACREFVILVSLPAKLMHECAERYSTVHNAASDDNICAGIEGCGNRKGAQVSINAHDVLRQRLTRAHFSDTGGPEFIGAIKQVVSFNNPDTQCNTGFVSDFLQGGLAGFKVYAPRVGNDFNLFLCDIFDQGFHCRGHKVCGVTQLIRFCVGFCQN